MEKYIQTIENALLAIGVEPENARNADEGQWSIFRGEIEIFLDFWMTGDEETWNYYWEEKNVPVFQVIAPICNLPTFNTEEFYQDLLELNLQLFYGSFMIKKEENMLCVKYRFTSNDFSVDHVVQAIESISYYAEFFQTRLMAKYQVSAV